jgi:hypothetical protein
MLSTISALKARFKLIFLNTFSSLGSSIAISGTVNRLIEGDHGSKASVSAEVGKSVAIQSNALTTSLPVKYPAAHTCKPGMGLPG